jgi:hypothetical protein
MSVRNALHKVLWFAQRISARSREQFIWILHLHPMISLITSLNSVTVLDINPIMIKQWNAFGFPLAFGPSVLHHDEIGSLVHFPLDSSTMLLYSSFLPNHV